MVEVVATDEFLAWYEGLDDPAYEATFKAVEVLRANGVSLGFPRSSDIKGARYAIRELRYQVGGDPFRVFYAFDAAREAVLILGGEKQGGNRFYERMIPQVEKIWEQYLVERREKP